MDLHDAHRQHLRRCVELAREALEAGDFPFGSVLVGADGRVLAERLNQERTGQPLAHPEIDLARWAGEHLSPLERAGSTVFTSGEHCAMCSAAHAWVGLGPIVYAVSSRQLDEWRRDWGATPVASAQPVSQDQNSASRSGSAESSGSAATGPAPA